jgi:hypothetical protein
MMKPRGAVVGTICFEGVFDFLSLEDHLLKGGEVKLTAFCGIKPVIVVEVIEKKEEVPF